MASKPSVIISAFADEAANYRTALEQMTALAAIGIRNYSPRFIDVAGDGTVEHVVDLSPEKLERLKEYHAEYGVRACVRDRASAGWRRRPLLVRVDHPLPAPPPPGPHRVLATFLFLHWSCM